jgi:hypothetical protein
MNAFSQPAAIAFVQVLGLPIEQHSLILLLVLHSILYHLTIYAILNIFAYFTMDEHILVPKSKLKEIAILQNYIMMQFTYLLILTTYKLKAFEYIQERAIYINGGRYIYITNSYV